MGVAVFFPGEPVALLATTLPMYIAFAALNQNMQPCLVGWVNVGRTYSYVISAFACVSSLLLVAGLDKNVCWVVNFIGCGVLLLVGGWRVWAAHSRLHEVAKSKVVPEEEADLVQQEDGEKGDVKQDGEEGKGDPDDIGETI